MTTNQSHPQAITAELAEQMMLAQLGETESKLENAVWELVRLYSVTGRQPEAFVYVKRLLNGTNDLEKHARYCLALGQLMEQVHDYESALTHYTHGLALETVEPQTCYFLNNNLGYCLNHFGRYVEAERYCQTAIQKDPQRYNAYKNLGISLEGQGLYAPAARCFIAAVQAEAADPRAFRHLEQLFARHPEIAVESPEITERVEQCRNAVQTAMGSRTRPSLP